MKKTFKRSDVIDQEKLEKDIQETFERLKQNKNSIET